MTRRFLISSLAVGLLALGGSNAQAGSVSLDSLLGTTVPYGGLDFTFDTWAPTGGAPTAPNVSVTFTNIGGEVGFTLNGSFGAGPGGTSDGNLLFNVSGANITDAYLTGNPTLNSGNTGGQATVTETIYGGPNILGPNIANLLIQAPGPLIDGPVAFAQPWTTITVDKDIEAIGGSSGVSISSVSQVFSVPEPTSLGLIGIGLSGLFTLRRLFRRTSVA
jgi:hypothetical protein